MSIVSLVFVLIAVFCNLFTTVDYVSKTAYGLMACIAVLQSIQLLLKTIEQYTCSGPTTWLNRQDDDDKGGDDSYDR